MRPKIKNQVNSLEFVKDLKMVMIGSKLKN